MADIGRDAEAGCCLARHARHRAAIDRLRNTLTDLRREHETALRRLDLQRARVAALEEQLGVAVKQRDIARACAAGLMEAGDVTGCPAPAAAPAAPDPLFQGAHP